MEFQERIPEIKSRYNLVDEMRRDYPDIFVRDHNRGGKHYVKCPYHGDHHASAIVDEEFFWCMVCREPVDIIEYVMRRDNVSKYDAIQKLADGIDMGDNRVPVKRDPAEEKRRAAESAEALRKLTWLAEVYTKNLPMAMPYFSTRALSEQTARHFHLGGKPDFTWKSEVPGHDVTLTAPRYAIPNLRSNTAVAVKLRRDDAKAIEIFETTDILSNSERIDIRYAIADLYGIEPHREKVYPHLLDLMFGPKYWQHSGSSNRIFNLDRVASIVDGSLQNKRLSYVVVVEGEVDAMSMEQAGYPAVAVFNTTPDIHLAFRGVEQVFYLADNDTTKIHNGRITNAGRQKGEALMTELQRSLPNIVRASFAREGFSDANDMIVRGVIHDYMKAKGFRPTLQATA